MHIQELSLQTRHLTDQKTFYHTTLGLPLLVETTDSFTIQAGTTRLRFQETEADVLYHVAFSIPYTNFREAKEWVDERIPLLAITGSQQAYSPTSPLRMWNKESENEVFFRWEAQPLQHGLSNPCLVYFYLSFVNSKISAILLTNTI